jgi:hypothetical protein
MIQLVKKFHTVAEYFALEKVAESRSEYINGETIPTAGASKNHLIILANLSGELLAG